MSCFAQEKGLPLFSDDFSTIATFAEKWVPNVKGPKPQPQVGHIAFPGHGTLVTRTATPQQFYAQMELTLAPSDNVKSDETVFGGFMIESYKFLVRSDGKSWMIYKLKGFERARGKVTAIADFEPGKSVVKLTLIRKVENGVATYIFRANGKDAGSFVCDAPVAPDPQQPDRFKPLTIWSYKMDMNLLDYEMSTLKQSDADSPNLIINSSFEYDQEGIPLYYVRQGRYDYAKSTAPYEDFLAGWVLDTQEKHSGNQSLRMTMNPDVTTREGLMAWGAGTVKGMSGVFSVWLKADRENLPVRLQYGKSKIVHVATQWQRYEIVNPDLPKPSVLSPVRILFQNTPGTLWVDDLQAQFINIPDETDLKADATFATAYKPSNLDQAKFGQRQGPQRAPEITIMQLPSDVLPTVNLDTWKNRATKLDTFFCKLDQATNKTEAYIACDKTNLYIGYRCFTPDLSAVDTARGDHDSFRIFGGRDSVEFFLDPSGTGEDYYQLAADAGGSRTDLGIGHDKSWNGDWQSLSKLNHKTKSIDYLITVPFATLAGPQMQSRWLVNFGRNDVATKESGSIIKTISGRFNQTAYWAQMNLPSSVVDQYRLGVTVGGYTDKTDGRRVLLTLANLTGEDQSVTVEFFDAQGDAGKLAEKQLTLRMGQNDLSFLSPVNNSKVKVKLTQANHPLSEQMIVLGKRTPVTILSRLDYYMNETEALFKVTTSLASDQQLTAKCTAAGQSVTVPVSAKFNVAIPLDQIPDGEHAVDLSLFNGHRKVASTSTTLIKRPYQKGATQINQFTRSLIHDDEPIFQFAPLLVAGWSHQKREYFQGVVDFYARHGFKYLHLLVQPAALEQGVWALKSAQEHGIRVMLWTKYFEATDEQMASMRKQLDFPNVYCQMVIDEPELKLPSDVTRDFLRRIKPLFPYHPVMMNNTVLGIPGRYANLETDILMIDDYITNTENRTVASVVKATDLMYQAGEEQGKPCYYFVISQAYHHYREPTYGEQIAQVYGNIAAGCTGISYFDSTPKNPTNWKAFIQLNKEIQSLTEVLLSEQEIGQATCSADPKLLRNATYLHDGFAYVIACNIDENTMGKVDFILPAGWTYAGQAQVMFEDRQLPVTDSKFTDNFPGHSRHVYKIKVKKP
ncbi:MAG: hypothetical protein CMJ19_17685 [Phycisphaeraceae bacterium]|nr:hypothetical protein [Phycisphaeraceae bacterium]